MLTRPQRGFSLVELMVSVTVGLLVLSGVIAVFSNTVAGSADNLAASRLTHDLRAYTDIIIRDLRRAGYSGTRPGFDNDNDGDIDSQDLTFNPFSDANNDVQVSNAGGESPSSCILFSYNLDADVEGTTTGPRVGCGTSCTPVGFEDNDNLEQFGYQLKNGALRMRTGGDSPPSCNSGRWETLTDPEIKVSRLRFELSTTEFDHADEDNACDSGNPCQYMRVVTLTLEGNLAAQETTRQTIVQEVRLRNDRYVVAAP